MTDAKAKRLGRACAIACKLASEVEGLYRLRADLHVEVQELVGGESATRFVNAIMSDCFPSSRLGEMFRQLAEAAEGGAK